MIKTWMKLILLWLAMGGMASATDTESQFDMEIQLLTHDLLGKVTLDLDALMQWLKPKNEAIQRHMEALDGKHEALVLVTLHHDTAATITIGTADEQEGELIAAIDKIVRADAAPKTKLVDYSFYIRARVGGAKKTELVDLHPTITLPEDERRKRFMSLSLVEKRQHLQQWLSEEVLPVVAAYEVNVEERFEGVRAVGQIVVEKQYLDRDINELTDNNPLYWRAIMEMEQGNQLITFTKACMHLVRGELDLGERYLTISRFFSKPETLASHSMAPLREMLSSISDELNAEIEKGIELHDHGRYTEAISHYQKWLKYFPNSAFLNYEYYVSKREAEGGKEGFGALWKKHRPLVYSSDPMYPVDVSASSGEEGYRVFRRMKVKEMFRERDKFRGDLIEYADIALDLENYSISGHMYWMILSHLSAEDYRGRDMVAHYLYSINKLGIHGMEENFVGDFPSEFQAIEQERREIMEGSDIYNRFKVGSSKSETK